MRGAIRCFKRTTGNPALDYMPACCLLHLPTPPPPPLPPTSPPRKPRNGQLFTEGASTLPWPASPPGSIAFPKKNLCVSSDSTPRLGVKTDPPPQPRGGSTFLHLLSRLITRAPVVLGGLVWILCFYCKGFCLNPPPLKKNKTPKKTYI